MHSWDLMKHYIGNGVQSYFYWNTSLLEGGISTWGWRQNSLVVVDKETKTFRYTPEYYVLKHVSHYVRPGARVLDLGGTCEEALGFLNPDGQVVLVLANKGEAPKTVSVSGLKSAPKSFTLPAQSINTILL
jgi:glucosylceramidase